MFGIAGGVVGYYVHEEVHSYFAIETLLTYVLGGAISGAFSFLALMFLIFWVIPGFIIGAWQGLKKGLIAGIIIGPIAGIITACNFPSQIVEYGLLATVLGFLAIVGVLVLIGAIAGGICGPKAAKQLFNKSY